MEEYEKTEFNEAELKLGEASIMANSKKMNFPKLGEVHVKFPTISEETEINLFYAQEFNRLLVETNLLDRKRYMEMLSKKGIWKEEDDQAIKDLQELYFSKSVSIESIKAKKRKSADDDMNLAELERDRHKVYVDLISKTMDRENLLENTLERKAEMEALYYKIVLCSYKNNGDKYWSSLEEFKSCNSIPELSDFISECVSFWRGENVPLFGNSLSQPTGSENTE